MEVINNLEQEVQHWKTRYEEVRDKYVMLKEHSA